MPRVYVDLAGGLTQRALRKRPSVEGLQFTVCPLGICGLHAGFWAPQ
mgnify:CR=1 FL=1